jgi:hypothetical protein
VSFNDPRGRGSKRGPGSGPNSDLIQEAGSEDEYWKKDIILLIQHALIAYLLIIILFINN